MLGLIDRFASEFSAKGFVVTAPQMRQTLSEDELCRLVPEHDGWIIGDDPATRVVLMHGVAGRLRAAVKWGVGVDNVNFAAARELGLPVSNTPGVFGAEVADIALGYLIALARETFVIDRGVRRGEWPKPVGISLGGKRLALVGYGDIGRNIAARAAACGMLVRVYDPIISDAQALVPHEHATWPARLDECDFIVFACALTPTSRHMFNEDCVDRVSTGVRIVNVSRGQVIEESALIEGLREGRVHSAALDVFEQEPLPERSLLRQFDQCIFGSHNSSNTVDAVTRVSHLAIGRLAELLEQRHVLS